MVQAFEMLEERLMLAAQPVVGITDPGEVPIGETVDVTLTFDNQPDGSPGGDVGFGPYIDLILPQNGADGAGVGSDPPNENDGITFAAATFLGRPLGATVIEFDANGEATHPFARDAAGVLRVVRAADYGAAAGDQLVVLQLPFGSFTSAQTPAQISVSLNTSNLADANVPLPITAVGGFTFGRDPLNNPTADPPVLGPPATGTVVPTIGQLTKSFTGPDGETATGPNFPNSYLLTLDIADGQTLTDVVLRDLLPDGIVVTGTSILTGQSGTITLDPLTNDLTVTLNDPVLGGPGADAQVRVDFYVGQFLTPGDPTTPVLDPATGAPRVMANDLSLTSTWDPIDPRDPVTTVTIDPAGPENVFTARSLALQKSAEVIGGGSPEPGDTVRWTISGQLSDFFSAGGLVLNDTLSDGQVVAAASPVLILRDGATVVSTGAIDGTNFDITVNPDGTTTLVFRVSDELARRGLDPTLVGGRVGDPTGATTFQVAFESVVQRFYADGRPLLQGDALGNTLGGAGTLPGSGNSIGDTGQAGLELDRGQGLTKDVYLINGTPPTVPSPAVTNSDTVTFRLRYSLPTGSANSFVLTDFLPLPMLLPRGDGGLPLTFLDIRNDGLDPATLPPVGSAWFHPDETFDLVNPTGYAGAPTVTTDAAANAIRFDFGSFFLPTPQPLQVDILVRLRVEDVPFSDNLFVTNQITAREANTLGEVVETTEIAQILITQPLLNISKGVVGVTTGQTTFPTTFNPATVAPLPFAAPGTAGVPFVGPLTTFALTGTPIDSDLTGVDAGDLVRFAIVVENTGRGIRGAHDILIRDTLPAGFEVDSGAFNLTVTRGDGQAIPFQLEGSGLFDPAGGIELLDPTDFDPANRDGALTRFTTESPEPGVPPTAPTGSNLAVIVYDLRVAPGTQTAGLAMTNTTEIANYAAQEGGADFAANLLPEDRTDDATVVTGDPRVVKDLISTSLGESVDPSMLIGEEALFRVTLTLREGLTRDVVLTDLLPTVPGILSLVDWRLTDIGSNLAITGNPPPLNVPQTGPITIGLGDVTNGADNVVDGRDQVVIEVRGRVIDLPANNRGDVLVNTATARFTDALGTTRSVEDSDSVTIIEPTPLIIKDADRISADGGDVVTYTVTITNPGIDAFSAPVFDLDIGDAFNDPDLTLVAGTVSLGGTAAGSASILVGNRPADSSIRVVLPRLDTDATLTITYQGQISDTVESGKIVRNIATLVGDSAPGPVLGERVYEDVDGADVRVRAPTLAKTVIDTGLADTTNAQGNPALPDLAFGETVTFRLRTTFSEGITSNVVLRDFLPVLPEQLEVLSATIVAVGSQIVAPGAIVGATGDLSDRSGDGLNDTATFTIGTVTNAPNGVIDARDRMDIQVVARLRSDGAGAGGETLVNEARLTFTTDGGPRGVTARASVETVLPRLTIDKTVAPETADGGDSVAYTVRFQNNAGPFAATAFDLVLRDLLDDPDLDLLPGSVTVAGVPATIVEGNGAGDTDVLIALDRLGIGETLVVTYRGVIAAQVVAGDQVSNTASYTADTHPGLTPGEQPLAGSDGATVQIGTPLLDKQVFSTSLPETGSGAFDPTIVDLAVGETAIYRLTITLPEAVNVDLRVVDSLPTSNGILEFLSYAILPLPPTSNIGFVPGTEVDTVYDTNGDGRNDRLSLDFGSLTNTPDGIVDENDQIVIEITARLVNVPANTAGDRLVNVAQTFLGATPLGIATADVEVVEPDLRILKEPDVPTGDAGDEILWRLTIVNGPGATGPAYDLRLTDLVPQGATIVAGSVVADRGTITSGNTPGDTTITLDASALAVLPVDDPLTPGVDETRITVTYRVRLDDSVEPGQVLTNTASFTALTAPGDSVGGEARPLSGSVTGTTTVLMPLTFEKAIVLTSNPETGSGAFDPANPDLGIGETVTYRLTATLSEGTQRLVIGDQLPPGIEFVAAQVVSIGAGLSPALLGTPATVNGQSVQFDFGTVVNIGNNVAGDGTVAVEITGRVADEPGNQAGTVLTNAGSATVSSPTSPGAPGGTQTATDSTSADVVAPALLLDKTADGGFARPGENITYTLTLRHAASSTGPAHDLVITDPLTAGNLVLVPGSVVASAGSVVIGNGAGDRSIRVELDTLAVGQEVTVTFIATVADGAPGGGAVTNVSTVAFDSNPGPGGRPGTVADDETMPLAPGFTKTIVDSSLPETTGTDVAVGERITYELTAVLPEGAIDGLIIADLLPAGLRPLSATVVAVGGGITGGALAPGAGGTITGQAVSFAFGDVVNVSGPAIDDADRIVVRIEAFVVDDPGSVSGTVLTNDGSLTFEINREPGREEAVVPVTVVEPMVEITKSVDLPSGDAGDVFTYTVTIDPQAIGAGPAFDLVVTDVLDPLLIPVSVNSTLGVASITGQTVRLEIPVLLPTDAPVVLTYQARFADTIEPGFVVDNLAELTYDSLPGPGGRAFTDSDNATVIGVFTVSIDKQIVATSNPETGSDLFDPANPDLTVGETITYRLTTTLSEGTQRLIITDTLGTGLAFVGAAVVSVGSALPPALLATAPALNGQTVSFDFGTLVNPGNNVPGDGTVVIEITARVTEEAGTVVTNTSTANVTSPTNPNAPGGSISASDSADADVERFIDGPPVDDEGASLAREIEDFLAREAQIRAAQFTLPPMFSGAAAPGAVITLAVRDGSGQAVGLETRVADVGGNWLVPLPGLGSPPAPRETTATLQAESRFFAERDLGLNATLPDVTRAEVPNTSAGGDGAVTVQQTAPLFSGLALGPDSTRVYFAGPVNPLAFASAPVDAPTGARTGGIAATGPEVAQVTRPFGLALNKFALDFLAGSTVPSGPLN
jgi:fimbrial isopeptide formation D2 family protein/uncharacterized repeat protein (TIGR01451 family)